jgi:hypothetical protein
VQVSTKEILGVLLRNIYLLVSVYVVLGLLDHSTLVLLEPPCWDIGFEDLVKFLQRSSLRLRNEAVKPHHADEVRCGPNVRVLGSPNLVSPALEILVLILTN